MKDNPDLNKEKYPKRDYMGISVNTNYIPKKNQALTIRRMVNCSECGKDSIVSLNFDIKTLKKYIEISSKSTKKRDKELVKLFERLVNNTPPKS